jgi:hypothetical protein
MITITSTCRHVARAAGVVEPSDPIAWEAWLQPGENLYVTDVVSLGGIRRDSTDGYPTDYPTWRFPEARAAGSDVEDLDQLARDWLIYWLLDTGTRNFEDRVAGWDRPEFLRMPDLALQATDPPGRAHHAHATIEE